MNKKILLPLALLAFGATAMFMSKKGSKNGSMFSREELATYDSKVIIDQTGTWFGVKNGKLYKFKEDRGYKDWLQAFGIFQPEQIKLDFPLWSNWDYKTLDSSVDFTYDY